MSDTSFISADRYERAEPGPIGQRPIEDILFTNQAVNSLLDAYMQDPGYAPFHSYPRFLRRLAEYQIANPGSQPSPGLLGTWARTYGVPQNVFNGGSGGGGTNRANTLLSLQQAILNRSLALGVTFTPEEISYIANVALQLDYSQEQLMNDIVNLAKTKELGPGDLTAVQGNLQAVAKNYLISLDPSVYTDWSTRIAKGQATEDSFAAFVQAQAKIANPWLGEYIDQGLSPNELLQNARAQIAAGLEIDPMSIDFAKSDYMKLATITDDKGNVRLANNSELRANLRQDPRWENTDAAKQMTATLARRIAQIFGRSVF